MALPSFTSWLEHRDDHHVPEADRVVPLIGSSPGMTRKQIGSAIDLDRDVLTSLLAGLVASGMLRMTWENGLPVFRAASVGTGS